MSTAPWHEPTFVDWGAREPFSLDPRALGTNADLPAAHPRSFSFFSSLISGAIEKGRRSPALVPPELRSAFASIKLWLSQSHLQPALDASFYQRLEQSRAVEELVAAAAEIIGRLSASINGGGLSPGAASPAPFILPVPLRDGGKNSAFLLFVFFRGAANGAAPLATSRLNLAVINPSPLGAKYHSVSVDLAAAPGAVLKNIVFLVEDVDTRLLLHSSFWLPLLRLAANPSDANPDTLYTVLLPHLNRKPTLANWPIPAAAAAGAAAGVAAPPAAVAEATGNTVSSPAAAVAFNVRFRSRGSAARTGTPSAVPSTLACIRLLLLLAGPMPPVDAEWCLLFLLFVAAESCREALDDFGTAAAAAPAGACDLVHLRVLEQFLRKFARAAAALCEAIPGASAVPHAPGRVSGELLEAYKKSISRLDQLVTEKMRLFQPGLRAVLSSLEGDNDGWLSSTIKGGPPERGRPEPWGSVAAPDPPTSFPFFGRFRNDLVNDWSALAGVEPRPQLCVPVDLAHIARMPVRTLGDVCDVLRATLEACVLLGNQRQLVRNSYLLRFCLICHVIVEKLPLPLPPYSRARAGRCFWKSQRITRVLQTELLRLMHAIARHFVVAFLALHNTRESDAKRILCLGAMACMADTVLRRSPEDQSSVIAGHYSGAADGPGTPFAFQVQFLADQSEFFLLLDPNFAVARTQILDYFADLNREVSKAPDRVMFNFERSLQPAASDRAFLEQVCLQYGFPLDLPEDVLRYYTGAVGEFNDVCCEHGFLRDIVFYLKMTLCPHSDLLPPQSRYDVNAATLSWSATAGGGSISVSGFGMGELKCAGYVKRDFLEKRRLGGLMTKFLGWLGMAAQRVPPSAADPSTLLLDKNVKLESEEDVLHIAKLPDFGEKLSQQDSEVLLQYLTAPYLRIPLILQFFAEESRINSLSSPDLQDVVLAAVFEPSLYQDPWNISTVSVVPEKSRACLATPSGLLFNELIFAPEQVMSALELLLDIALEKDTGKPVGAGANLILFVTRLVISVKAYGECVSKHISYWKSDAGREQPESAIPAAADREPPAGALFGVIEDPPTSLRSAGSAMQSGIAVGVEPPALAALAPSSPAARPLSLCGFRAAVRGLNRPSALPGLSRVLRRLSRRLSHDVLPLFRQWARKALREGGASLVAATRIYAHASIVHEFLDEPDYAPGSAGTLMQSLFFVLSHHYFTSEMTPAFFDDAPQAAAEDQALEGGDSAAISRAHGERLSVSDLRIYSILQRHRAPLLAWLAADPGRRDCELDAVVATVSLRDKSECTRKNHALQLVDADTGGWCPKEEKDRCPVGPSASPGPEDTEFSAEAPGRLSLDLTVFSEEFTHVTRAPNNNCVGPGPSSGSTTKWAEITSFGGNGRFVTEAADAAISSAKTAVEKALSSGGSDSATVRQNVIQGLAAAVTTASAGVVSDLMQLLRPPGGTGARSAAAVKMSLYEVWLRAVTLQCADLELNFQIGELALKKNSLRLLDTWVNAFPDFRAIFDAVSPSSVIQSVLVSKTENRYWCRLVGMRHDLQRWRASLTHAPFVPYSRVYNASVLTAAEAWVSPLLQAWLPRHFPGAQLFIDQAAAEFCPASCLRFAFFWPPNQHTRAENSTGPGLPEKKTPLLPAEFEFRAPTSAAVKEIVVYRDPPCIDVFDVVERGRKFDSVLVYTSDINVSFGELPAATPLEFEAAWKQVAANSQEPFFAGPTLSSGAARGAAPGPSPAPSLVITRNLYRSKGSQVFVPFRALHGLLPAALLSEYNFWHEPDSNTITGYLKKRGDELRIRLLKISVLPSGEAEKIGKGAGGFVLSGSASATVRRYSSPLDQVRTAMHEAQGGARSLHAAYLMSAEEHFERSIAAEGFAAETQTLINLKAVARGTSLYSLRNLLCRVDSLSHILVWVESGDRKNFLPSAAQAGLPFSLAVELPRLGLSFSTEKVAGSDQVRLVCAQHAGLFISTTAISPTSLTARLTASLPNSLILEDADANLHLLLDATAKPVLVPAGAAGRATAGAPGAAPGASGGSPHADSAAVHAKDPGHSWAYSSSFEAFEEQIRHAIAPWCLLHRNDAEWQRSKTTARYYVYGIHSSKAFLFVPTPSAGLLLLMWRFICLEFEQVCALADAYHFFESTSSDSEARRMWEVMNSTEYAASAHPNAHAARLKIGLALAGQFDDVERAGAAVTLVRKAGGQIEQLRLQATSFLSSAIRFAGRGPGSSPKIADSAVAYSGVGREKEVNLDLWSAEQDLVEYLEKLPYVTANCRLSLSEELELLRSYPSKVQNLSALHNRQMVLTAVRDQVREPAGPGTVCKLTVRDLRLPATPAIADFDVLDDRSAVRGGTSLDQMQNLLGAIVPFRAPEMAVTGPEAAVLFIRALERPKKLFAEWHFIYELLADHAATLRVLSGETTHGWGALLTRFLPAWDYSNRSSLMSVLRVLMHNPEVASQLPSLQQEKKTHRLNINLVMRSNDTFKTFYKELIHALREKDAANQLYWYAYEQGHFAPETGVSEPTSDSTEPLQSAKSRRRTPSGSKTERKQSSPRTKVATRSAIGAWLEKTRRKTFDLVVPSDAINRGFFNQSSSDTRCQQREFSSVKFAADLQAVPAACVEAFAGQPLSQFVKLDAVVRSVARGGPAVSGALPFQLDAHPIIRTPLGRSTLLRLRNDAERHAADLNSKVRFELLFLPEEEIATILRSASRLTDAISALCLLRNLLADVYAKDALFVESAIASATDLVNFPRSPVVGETTSGTGWAFSFYKLAHAEPQLHFDSLVALQMSSQAQKSLARINPYLSSDDFASVQSLAAAAMFAVNRRAQTSRCIGLAAELLRELQAALRDAELAGGRASAPPGASAPPVARLAADLVHEDRRHLEARVRLLAQTLVAGVTAARHYMRVADRRTVYDPRFLVFEFAYNLLLRRQQVDLIRRFERTVDQDQSLCHQAIMGSGKTTVVAPLLGLLLANGQRLIVQIVPQALLEFTRVTLQERFSAVIKKTVVTFRFSRYATVTTHLFTRLVQAKERGSIVLSSPTAVKSIFLKVLLILDSLDRSANAAPDSAFDSIALVRTGRAHVKRLRNALGKTLRLPILCTDSNLQSTSGVDGGSAKLTDEQVRLARRELDLALRVLYLFESAVVLLDEVDLLLHPLKSELHWPVGPKQPLDVAVSHVETRGDEAFRWRLPWHLLDAIFYAQDRRDVRTLSVPFAASSEALRDLELIRQAVEQGVRELWLQRTPHLTLLSEPHYHAVLKPHLARWLVHELRAMKFAGMAPEAVVQLLTTPPGPPNPGDVLFERLAAETAALDDAHVRLLNHGRAWLNVYCPHVLQKVNRVTYGLMTPAEIAQQTALNPAMPASRTLLAVPFTGKDSPSLSSEFSHPDVVIGLTILAYRYSGMRRADLFNLLSDQVQRLALGFGRLSERPAAREYALWVSLAGGRVRGSRRARGTGGAFAGDVPSDGRADGEMVRRYVVYAHNPFGAGSAALSMAHLSNLSIDLLEEVGAAGAVGVKGAGAATVGTDGGGGSGGGGGGSGSGARFGGSLGGGASGLHGVNSSAVPAVPDVPPPQYEVSTGGPGPSGTPVQSAVEALIAGATAAPALDDSRLFQRLWPLELIAPSDAEQFNFLYPRLWRQPLPIRALLFNVVFPLSLQHSRRQLSASGQELGGSAVFGTRLGFSGTPSELLPLEFGKTEFELGTDGRVLHHLTDPAIVAVELLPRTWSVDSLLTAVAARTDVHAFIDAGALVTGLSNLQVARTLLRRGLRHVAGVVYLDEEDRQMVLVRDGWTCMRLAQCGLSLENRFSFYDQVHTTGQDIRQAPGIRGLLTVGKDMTFRDLAQGAWRLRGIGSGQTLVLQLTREVADLVQRTARLIGLVGMDRTLFAAAEACGSEAAGLILADEGEGAVTDPVAAAVRGAGGRSGDGFTSAGFTSTAAQRVDLAAVCAWLTVRGVEGEIAQQRLLALQCLRNIMRKKAFSTLKHYHSEIGNGPVDGRLKQALDLFRETLDFSVPTTLDQRQSYFTELEELARTAQDHYALSEAEQAAVRNIVASGRRSAETARSSAGSKMAPDPSVGFAVVEAEITQEQEQEQEEEEEEEKEQEQEKELEQEQQVVDENPAAKRYARHDEVQRWPLQLLESVVIDNEHFYGLSHFGVLTQNKRTGGRSVALINLSQNICFSRNWFLPPLAEKSSVRPRNVLVILEWFSGDLCARSKRGNSVSGAGPRSPAKEPYRDDLQRTRLAKAFLLTAGTTSRAKTGTSSVPGTIDQLQLAVLLSALEFRCGARTTGRGSFLGLVVASIARQRSATAAKLAERDFSSHVHAHLEAEPAAAPRSMRDLFLMQEKTPSKSATTRGQQPAPLANLLDAATDGSLGTGGSAREPAGINASRQVSPTLASLDPSHFNTSDLIGIANAPIPPALPPTDYDPFEDLVSRENASPPAFHSTVAENSVLPPQAVLRDITFAELDKALTSVGAGDDDTPWSRFLVLTLEEAETVRAAIHAFERREGSGPASVVPNRSVKIALRHVSAHTLRALDGSVGAGKSGAPGLESLDTAHAVLSLANSADTVSARHADLLLRVLQRNQAQARQSWYAALRGSRRRQQFASGFPPSPALSRVLFAEDDVPLVLFRLAGLKWREFLRNRGMSLSDGFRAMDVAHEDRVSPAQVFAGLRFAGCALAVEDFAEIWSMTVGDGAGGFVGSSEYTDLFTPPVGFAADQARGEFTYLFASDRAAALHPAAAVSGLPVTFPPVADVLTTAELQALSALGAQSVFALDALEPAFVERFRLKLQPHAAFRRVWEGPGTTLFGDPAGARVGAVAVWAPEGLSARARGVTKRNRQRVCLGHFFSAGGADVQKYLLKHGNRCPRVLEIEDTRASAVSESPCVQEMIDLLLPHPVKFKLLFRANAQEPIAVWKPVPPTHFAAVGVLVTAGNSTPPDVTNIRCVPERWITRTEGSFVIGKLTASSEHLSFALAGRCAQLIVRASGEHVLDFPANEFGLTLEPPPRGPGKSQEISGPSTNLGTAHGGGLDLLDEYGMLEESVRPIMESVRAKIPRPVLTEPKSAVRSMAWF